ncbi:MAG: hypothetical protein ACRDLT_13965 [Solirubrobacteraceae bacterium]
MANAKLTHRTQLFLTDEQYRWLKIKADAGSIAAVVRDWIDSEMHVDPEDLRNDPAIKFLLEGPVDTSGGPSTVTTIDQDLYG